MFLRVRPLSLSFCEFYANQYVTYNSATTTFLIFKVLETKKKKHLRLKMFCLFAFLNELFLFGTSRALHISLRKNSL